MALEWFYKQSLQEHTIILISLGEHHIQEMMATRILLARRQQEQKREAHLLQRLQLEECFKVSLVLIINDYISRIDSY